MPKGTGGVTAAILLVLLTGCTAAPPDPDVSTPVPTVAQETPTETTPPPLVAETPNPGEANEAAFLTRFRELQSGYATQIPGASDEQLIAAGQEACERYAAGEDWEKMSVIEGEAANEVGRYLDSTSILSAARLHLCAD